jgi:hypothetical protein
LWINRIGDASSRKNGEKSVKVMTLTPDGINCCEEAMLDTLSDENCVL